MQEMVRLWGGRIPSHPLKVAFTCLLRIILEHMALTQEGSPVDGKGGEGSLWDISVRAM